MAEYIEREALFRAFENADPDVMADYGPEYGSEWGFSRDTISAVIGNIPAADVAPVAHGQWIHDRKEHVHCSNCGDGRNIRTQIAWKFCPSCGAKMQEVR